MKKAQTSLMILTVLTLVLLFPGCNTQGIEPESSERIENKEDTDNKGDSEILNHKHSYSSLWSYNEKHHWHQATCEHTDEVSDLAEHIFDDGKITKNPTSQENGIFTCNCTVCDFQKKYLVEKLQKHCLIQNGARTIHQKALKYDVYKTNYKCSYCGTTCTRYVFCNYGLNPAERAVEELNIMSLNVNYDTIVREACCLFADKIILKEELFTITYILNGGTNNFGNPEQYSKGSSVTLQAPTKPGEVFCGWYEDENFSGNRVYTIDSTSASNKTFYAKWQIDSYTITFDTQGGSAIAPQVVASNVQTEKPQNPTKENFDFVYWYYYDEYNQKREFFFGNYPSNDITLYAEWKERPVSVPISISILSGTDIEVTKTTNRNTTTFSVSNDYTVLGWYFDNSLVSSDNPYSVDAGTLSKGIYILELEASKNGNYYSYTVQIKIE